MLSWGMKTLIVGLGVLLGISVTAVPALETISAFSRKQEVSINSQTIVAEVVSKPADREKGLSGRTHLGINEGMLFAFETAGFHSFWMKDMQFPIDIIWVNDARIVGVTERVDPQVGVPESALAVLNPPEPVTRVLELAAGRAHLLGAKVGDTFTVRPLAGRAQ